MKRRIGVTGASGFIGKLLIQQLLQEGYHITALVRSKTSLLAGVDVVYGDLADTKSVDKFLKNIDVLIHLAGRQLPPEKEFFHDNVFATDTLLQRTKDF